MFRDCRSWLDPCRTEVQGGLAVVHLDPTLGASLLVAGMNGANRLYRLNNGGLQDQADPVLADAGSATLSVAGADIDRDGREEIYLHNSEVARGAKHVPDRLLAKFGPGWLDRFDDPSADRLLNRIAARGIVALDRTGGGKYGFLVAAHGGPIRLFELDAGGRCLIDSAPAVHLDELVGANGLAVLTLEDERRCVFVACENGPDLLFKPLPERTYAEVGARHGCCAEPGSRAAVPVDLNHDGRLDLVLAGACGPHRMLATSGGSGWSDIAPPLFAEPSNVRGVVVADFDNDGYEEIFLHHQGEPNRLFGWRDGRWRSLDPGDALEPAAPGLACVAADLDGDGVLELVTSYGEGGGYRLGWFKQAHMKPHHWIRIAPLTAAGAPARGARVILDASGRRQVRMIDAGSGYLSQNEPVAHFGLGQDRQVDRATIQWPDGTEVSLTHLAADRVHLAQHPARQRNAVGRAQRPLDR